MKLSSAKYLVVISLLIAVLFPLVNTYYILPSFKDVLIANAEEDAERIVAYFATSIVRDGRILDDFAGQRERLEELKGPLSLAKLQFFSPEGRVLYSSDPQDIGTVNTKDYFHQRVARGEKFTQVVVMETDLTSEGVQMKADVVETYVPIMQGGTFLGAAEVYYDITARREGINQALAHASLITVVIILLFLLVTNTLVLRQTDGVTLRDENLSAIYRSPYIPPLIIATLIFFAEGLVMVLLSTWPEMSVWTEALLDSSLLVMLLAPVFYYFLVLPLMKHISRLRQAEQEIHKLAYFDGLTGLPNRLLFQDRLTQAMAKGQRYKHKLALLYFDLDRFKEVNDSFGHGTGDLLLQLAAERLQKLVRRSDTLARVGGDEFCHLLSLVADDRGAVVAAEKIIAAMKAPFDLEGKKVFTSASIGIALFPENGTDAGTLQKHADIAMYEAKKNGRDGFAFFSEEMNRAALERRQLETDLRHALDHDEFSLVYQPQLDLRLGRIVGAEALLRWHHPQRGWVSPAQFIPMAEETGLIEPLGEWVLRTACQQNKAWQLSGLPPIRMAVNISAHQLRHPDFIDRVDLVLRETGLAPCWLELELTESLVMENAESNREVLAEISRRGIQLAIDDFGTGYSSLGYLKNFSVDRIKIDRSFVGQLPDDHSDAAIVETILAMARTLGLEVVAEGVETLEQLDFLKIRNCQSAQGYYLGRPMAAVAFLEHLQGFGLSVKAGLGGRAGGLAGEAKGALGGGR